MNITQAGQAIDNFITKVEATAVKDVAEIKAFIEKAASLEKKIAPDAQALLNDAIALYKVAKAAAPQVLTTIAALQALIADLTLALSAL